MTLRTLFVFAHVLAGTLSLLAGIISMIARKGGKNHRLWGKVYFWSMFTIFVSAIGLLFFRPNIFLFIISILSFYSALTGYRGLFRKQMAKGWNHAWLDWTAAIIAALAGVGFATWGALVQFGVIATEIPPVFGILGIVFGLMLASNARTDMISFRNPPTDRNWWWFYHMDRILGSYIAALTAFMVQNVGRLLPETMAWVVWVAPGLLGGIGISYWVNHYRRKFSQTKARRQSASPEKVFSGQ